MLHLIFSFASCFVINYSSAQEVSLPISADINSLIITEIDIHGEKFRFLIDTGASANFLSPEFVRKFNGTLIKRNASQDQTVANATSRQSAQAYDLDLSIGALRFESMLSFEQNTHRFNVKQDGLDCCAGILGIEFLKKYPLLVDRAQKTITLNSAPPPANAEWVSLPVAIPNGKTLILQCTSSLGPAVDLRLDTGSEFPLILQKRFLDKYAVIERYAAAPKSTAKMALPIVSFGQMICAKNMPAVRIDALAYTGATGALTHEFVDGNLGGAFLGKKYFLDIKNHVLALNRSQLIDDVRVKEMNSTVTIDLTPARLDEYFLGLRFLPIQERIKSGLNGLSKREIFAVGELLLTAASQSNENLGLSLLSSIASTDVPCIQYYKAESLFRKGHYNEAKTELDGFLKTKEIACAGDKTGVFSCCPASKYRNATGLKKLIATAIQNKPETNIVTKLPLTAYGTKSKLPLVSENGNTYLIDTGAEHNVWNSACAAELGLKIDKQAEYGGSDSLSQSVVAHHASPTKKIFGLPTANLDGFSIDLSDTVKDYEGVKKFCGIISPQRVIPQGVMVMDWAAGSVLFCQGDACRKSIDLPSNCPMYMFNGRPYVNFAVGDQAEKLFLLDTGANMTSANLNYFTNKPDLTSVEAKVSSVKGSSSTSNVIPQAKIDFCNLSFNLKPFPVRPASSSWEWRENGKVGMNVLGETLIALDFGKSAALFK